MRKLFAVLSVFVMLFFVFSFVFYPDAVYATESHDFSMGIVMIQTSCLFDGEIHYDCGHCEDPDGLYHGGYSRSGSTINRQHTGLGGVS